MEIPPSNSPADKIIFISHINEEREIAKTIEKELEDCFNHVRVFLSETIAFGDDWQEKLKKTLNRTDLILVLFSPNSTERPWINIEAGYGIISGKTVIPIYCLGLDQDKLHYAYQRLMGVKIDEPSDIKRLLVENIAANLLNDTSIEEEEVNRWIDRWQSNVVKTAISYFNQQVINIKLPYQSYFHIFNEFTNRCLDVFTWSKREKAKIIGYALHGGNNQLWQLQKIDETFFRIASKHSKLCLGVDDSNGQELAVLQYRYSSNDREKWDLTQISNSTYKISSMKYPDFCLTIQNDTEDPNISKILLLRWAHKWDQQWVFKITATITPV